METAAFASRFFEKLFLAPIRPSGPQTRKEQVTDGPTPIIHRPMGGRGGPGLDSRVRPGLGPATPSDKFSFSVCGDTEMPGDLVGGLDGL